METKHCRHRCMEDTTWVQIRVQDVRGKRLGQSSVTAGVHVGEQPRGDIKRRRDGAVARLHEPDVRGDEGLQCDIDKEGHDTIAMTSASCGWCQGTQRLGTVVSAAGHVLAERASSPPPAFWKPASASMRRWIPLNAAPSAVRAATIASAAVRIAGAGHRLRATSSMSSVCDLVKG